MAATKSSSITPSPPLIRRSMKLAGYGFNTSNSRNSRKPAAKAGHPAGTNNIVATIPATSSITILGLSRSPKSCSARPASQHPATNSPPKTSSPAIREYCQSGPKAPHHSAAPTIEPAVPGITGTKPLKKPVARKIIAVVPIPLPEIRKALCPNRELSDARLSGGKDRKERNDGMGGPRNT